MRGWSFFVDASFGEGISPALGYATIAAETIRDAFNSGDFSLAGYRDRILRHPLGKALRFRTLTAKVLYTQKSPAFQRLVWWRFPGLVRWYIETYLIHWTRKANAQGRDGE